MGGMCLGSFVLPRYLDTRKHPLRVYAALELGIGLMALKAPGILVFTLSIVLALAVLFSRFFGATIPYLTGDTTQFYAMWGAYLVLLLGCIMRGL